MELKEKTIYSVLSGWKLWETETSTTIAAQDDGSPFEIWYPLPFYDGATSLAAAATALITIFVF